MSSSPFQWGISATDLTDILLFIHDDRYKMVSIGLDLISVGCNCSLQVLDWGSNGIVAYGANSFALVYIIHLKDIWVL
jgi:hypothetical protein